MADNEKKFEIRLDQQKSEITAQVMHIWLIFSFEMNDLLTCTNTTLIIRNLQIERTFSSIFMFV
jgi:hypothetical protein